MTSRTETAIAAFVAALAAEAASGGRLPAPTRNLALADALDAVDGEASAHCNAVDGRTRVTDVQLGEPPTYEIEHEVEIEWIVQAAAQADRDAASDAGLEAIADTVDTINASVAAGGGPWGGVIDHAEIVEIDRSNLAVFGAPQLKGLTVAVRLTFTSPRPF